MTVLTVSQCRICSQLPCNSGVDLLDGKGEIHRTAFRLEGMPERLSNARSADVSCPECGALYALKVETGFMEHDVGLHRLTPTEAGDRLGPEEYDARIASLPAELDSDIEVARLYAARALAQHRIAVGDTQGLNELLRHPREELRRHALLYMKSAPLVGHLDALLPELLERLFDENGHTRDRASWMIRKAPPGLFSRLGSQIVEAMAGRPTGGPAFEVAAKLHEHAPEVDLSPLFVGYVRYLGDGEYAFLQKKIAELLREVASSGEDARAAVAHALEEGGDGVLLDMLRGLVDPDGDALAPLFAALDGDDVRVQVDAAQALAPRLAEAADPVPMARLLEHASSRVRLHALRAIRDAGIEPFVEPVLRVHAALPERKTWTGNHDTAVRQALGLHGSGGPAAGGILARCADRIVATLAQGAVGFYSARLLVDVAEQTEADVLPAVPSVAAFLRGGRARDWEMDWAVELLCTLASRS